MKKKPNEVSAKVMLKLHAKNVDVRMHAPWIASGKSIVVPTAQQPVKGRTNEPQKIV